MKEKNFTQIIIDKTIVKLKLISANKRIDFNVNDAYQYMVKTRQEKVKEIFLNVRKDMEESDILKGLDRKKPVLHSLTRQVMNISLDHECMKYAEEILMNCKI